MKYSQYDHRQNVLELQGMLRANRLLEGGPQVNPDGIFDQATAQALRLFQQQNGLAPTGKADCQTWQCLSACTAALQREVPCLDPCPLYSSPYRPQRPGFGRGGRRKRK